jgi:tetratricopeptide (TPR) repeat protein
MSESRMSQCPMVCPRCDACVPDDTTLCPDCLEDLSALIHLEQRHRILYNEALSLAREGVIVEAQERLHCALAVYESFPEAYSLLAKLHAHAGDWPEAQRCARRAQELQPDDGRVADLVESLEAEGISSQTDGEHRAESAATTPDARVRKVSALYERDVTAAFMAGVGVAASVASFYAWAKGRIRRRRG